MAHFTTPWLLIVPQYYSSDLNIGILAFEKKTSIFKKFPRETYDIVAYGEKSV